VISTPQEDGHDALGTDHSQLGSRSLAFGVPDNE